MKYRYIAIIALLVFALVIVPASAFTAKKLVINVQSNGDADVQFTYNLNAAEKLVYNMIPGEEQIVKWGIGTIYSSKKVKSIRVSKTITDLTVRDFATVTVNPNKPKTKTFKTPAVDFSKAQTPLDNFRNRFPWIGSKITPDFSPEVTIVKFPGNYQQTYNGVTKIPAITYTK
jgi:hypothetical protein